MSQHRQPIGSRRLDHRRSDRGAGLAEYALLLILLAIIFITVAGSFAATLNDMYSTIEATLPF